MLSNSFIVSASPVPSPLLTGFARKRSDGAFPTYANLRNNDANRINEFPEDNDTYNSSRRIKRSLSVSKSSDFVKQRQNIKSRSSSQTRCNQWEEKLNITLDNLYVSDPRESNSCVYQSPVSRPLPQTPSTDPFCKDKDDTRSVFENIKKFTREAESDIYYDTLDSQDKNRDSYSPASPMLRSRIPIKMDNYQTPGIRSRSVTQFNLRPESTSLDTTDRTITKKGFLWIQQDKMFSSWKERYVILTNSHLQIFKKGTTKFSDMGTFLNKITLSNLEKVSMEEKKGYLTILLVVGPPQPVRLLIRRPDGLLEWHQSILNNSKKRGFNGHLFRRQLSEYGTFQNLSKARRDSIDNSPNSSIGRQFNTISPLAQNIQTEPDSINDNFYCDNPRIGQDMVDAKYGFTPRKEPVYEVPVSHIPRFLQTPLPVNAHSVSSAFKKR